MRRFSVLKFISDGFLSDGIPSVTTFPSSNMNSANHLIGYISNSNFQIFKFKTNFCVCRFLLQNVFLKLINIFVFFVFSLVDAFSGSIKTERTQKILDRKLNLAKENFRALA